MEGLLIVLVILLGIAGSATRAMPTDAEAIAYLFLAVSLAVEEILIARRTIWGNATVATASP